MAGNGSAARRRDSLSPPQSPARSNISAPADVVLLDEPCRVGDGWLDRMRDAAYVDTNIASASALSDHGTPLARRTRRRPSGRSTSSTPSCRAHAQPATTPAERHSRARIYAATRSSSWTGSSAGSSSIGDRRLRPALSARWARTRAGDDGLWCRLVSPPTDARHRRCFARTTRPGAGPGAPPTRHKRRGARCVGGAPACAACPATGPRRARGDRWTRAPSAPTSRAPSARSSS